MGAMENKSLNIFNSRCISQLQTMHCNVIGFAGDFVHVERVGALQLNAVCRSLRLVLASPETATDMDYERIEGVVGHE